MFVAAGGGCCWWLLLVFAGGRCWWWSLLVVAGCHGCGIKSLRGYRVPDYRPFPVRVYPVKPF
jgi:hypothetical protein